MGHAESKISPFVSDMNQKNEELGYKKVGSKFSCKALEMDAPRIFCEKLEQRICFGKGCG